MERERGEIGVGADRRAAVRRADRAGGVLDDRDARAARTSAVHGVEVGGHARLVDDDDGARAAVSAGSIVSGVRFCVAGSTSANTGVAPT